MVSKKTRERIWSNRCPVGLSKKIEKKFPWKAGLNLCHPPLNTNTNKPLFDYNQQQNKVRRENR